MGERSTSRPVVAALVAVAGVAVLTAFAATAPVAMRKLVLYSVAFGMCGGSIVVWAAREFGLTRRWAMGLTVPLVVAGLMLVAAQGLRQLRNEQAAAATDDPRQAMARSILEAAAEDNPELASALQRERRERVPSFADYLALRVRPLGEWRQPLPILFWVGEVFVAAVAGALVASRVLRQPQDSGEMGG